ncbi:MAG: hypothetical protein K0R39_2132 [Symbiobacteriaceae bacterium]|jgi:ribonuclease HI|nr:hypothetical protein [Symbiobacteriaceae bacterium]
MGRHWLYGFKLGQHVNDINQEACEALASDPLAKAIPDLEAEQFMAASYLVLFGEGSLFVKLRKALRVEVSEKTEHGRQRAIKLILRQWKLSTVRGLLVFLNTNTGMGRFRDVATHPHIWTEELFQAAYDEETNICLLTQMKRHLDPNVNLDEWLPNLGEWAPEKYRCFLNVSRLTLRRIVYPDATPGKAAAQAAPALAEPAQVEDLRAKAQQSGALRQDVRRLEQDRKQLREKARRQEQARRQMLSQAQGDVAAARRQLNDRRQAMHRELLERAKRYEAELARLRRELDMARQEFVTAIAQRRGDFLRGRTVAVEGGNARENRALVESLGGRFVEAPGLGDGADIRIGGDGGPAAVELQLHGVVLAGLQIRCDGSHRRKGRRPGLATSAFQVYLGDAAVIERHRAICCGPLTSSKMAEYGAMVMALSWLHAARPAAGSQVELLSDCRWIVDHITGRRPLAPERGCAALEQKLRNLLRALAKRGCSVQLRWVKRDLVDAEDRLCDLAYREARWYHLPPKAGPRAPLSAFLRSLG